MFTKRRLAFFTVLMVVAYFFPMLSLPESIIGDRAGNLLHFVPKILFLSMAAAVTTSVVLILIFRQDFVQSQLTTFHRFKYLLMLLVKRDFVARYRKSVLGVVWSLLNPLLNMLVLSFVFSYLFRFRVENFPVYLLSGRIIFGFFDESTTLSMKSVLGNAGIIKKVYVPKYIFPVARTLSSLNSLFFSCLAFLLVVIITGAPFMWTMLLLPIPIIYTFVFALGIGMLLSSMAVFFHDLTHLYGVFTTLLMYLTPIIYPVEIIPERYRPLMGFNPIFHFVNYFRDLAIHGVIPDLWTNLVCIGFALAALCSGAYVFMSQQDKFILHL
jgi:ABC-type polysaccharide/polyol phosphate export permease